MKTLDLVAELRKITLANSELVSKKIARLSESQKAWKLNESTWSINEIFAHLNEFANFYHEAFRKKIASTKFREPKEVFVSSPLGKSAWSSMKLGNLRNVKRKFKANRLYNPTLNKTLVKGNDDQQFLVYQQELLQLIEDSKSVNIRKAKVATSLSKIVRLRLGDAFLFVVYHNERHIQQAINLINHRGFPQK